jgi:hypothetical protein
MSLEIAEGKDTCTGEEMNAWVIGILLLLQSNPHQDDLARLVGLDRFCFEHVNASGADSHSEVHFEDRLGGMIPEKYEPLPAPSPQDTAQYLDWEVRARDFPIPTTVTGRNLLLRQVSIVGTRSDGEMGAHRLDESWWALYDRGLRSDVWHYPSQPIDPMCMPQNLRIQDVSAVANGEIQLRILGSYFGMGGFWFVDGLLFSFSRTEEGLALGRVKDVFGFIHTDVHDLYGLRIHSAQEANGRIETRARRSVPDSLPDLATCGWKDPWWDDHWDSSWVQIEGVARCMTQGPDIEITTHSLDEPSSWERKKDPSR